MSVRGMIADAEAGRPVYINRVREEFVALPEGERDRLVLAVKPLGDGDEKAWELALPRLDRCSERERAFVYEYVDAEVYNILSSAGAREMIVYADSDSRGAVALAESLSGAFCVAMPRAQRRGYGRAINVLDRMIAAIYPGEPPFRFSVEPLSRLPAEVARQAAAAAVSAHSALSDAGDSLSAFRRCAAGLEGKAFCGVDVGGTDIKAVLVDDGEVVDFKEYDWFPASFVRSRQLVDPILLIVRLLQARLWLRRAPMAEDRRASLLALLAPAMGKKAGDAAMAEALAALSAEGFDGSPRFDGIGLCFPDVVVRNKIVGGEVYKTRGIRGNPDIDYEADFAELTGLDARLRAWVKPEGAVRIINDGPMAAFTAAVEIAASPKAGEVARGVFAHTLGTELGTGWVTETGAIPDIPLEVYNFVIDLGSRPERAYEPDDLRSVNNFNTGLPGTLQKYCSQSGVFRLAMKYFPTERPDLFRELRDKGFIVRRAPGAADAGAAGAEQIAAGAAPVAAGAANAGTGVAAASAAAPSAPAEGWYVPTEPVDQRKAFLEHMMKLPEREGDETNRRIWREIGESLAVTALETEHILAPGAAERFLFGRLVKNRACFDLIAEGARRIKPDLVLTVAGTGMANTPLMKALERHPEFTVAQFAQAIGAVYFANAGTQAAAAAHPKEQES
ncbi:hypothetical protein LWX53_01865 [bacterium]|nr:hypothetical protein [bacterium]